VLGRSVDSLPFVELEASLGYRIHADYPEPDEPILHPHILFL
jgi:hypothetical protein